MEWLEILKIFGPQAVPWIALYLIVKWLMERADKDLEGRIRMAVALENLTTLVKERIGHAKPD